jgi:hypothetical protein
VGKILRFFYLFREKERRTGSDLPTRDFAKKFTNTVDDLAAFLKIALDFRKVEILEALGCPSGSTANVLGKAPQPT